MKDLGKKFLKNRIIDFTFFIYVFSGYTTSYINAYPIPSIFQAEDENLGVLELYLLPKDHPLHENLEAIFHDNLMFRSPNNFKKAGFSVQGGNKITRSGHKKIMIGAHPSAPQYLFKKFPDSYPQSMQLKNFINRIKGAHLIRHYIQTHQFKHLVVPQKWLYKLPTHFYKGNAYLLIVEKMDIYHDWDDHYGHARQLYYHMDPEILTELCMTLQRCRWLRCVPQKSTIYKGW